MSVKDGSYVCIQSFMVNELHLSGNELIIYAVIFGFSQDEESWFVGSRSYLADWCQTSRVTVSNNLAKLCEKGLIEKRTRIENGVTFNDYRVCKNFPGVGKNFDGGVQKSCRGGVQESLPHNIEIDNIDDTINKEKNSTTRHKYGEYKNVLLTDSDMEKLQAEFPFDWKDRIERLSVYMASTGRTYKNHLATIRNWARRNGECSQSQAARAQKSDYIADGKTGWACFDED